MHKNIPKGISVTTHQKEVTVTQASINALRNDRMPFAPLNPEAAEEHKTKWEWVSEAGVVAATVAVTFFLSHVLQLGLENYAIHGL